MFVEFGCERAPGTHPRSAFDVGCRMGCVDDETQKQCRGSVQFEMQDGEDGEATHGGKSTELGAEFGVVENFTTTSII